MSRRQIAMSYSNLKWIGKSLWAQKPKCQAYLVEEKNFSGISNMLITGSAYLENVFLFTSTKTAELLFLFVQGSRHHWLGMSRLWETTTFVRTCDGDTTDFPINISLHQGSALSPYLFALVMDEVTRDIQGEIPWCMLFADDVVLVDE